MLEDLNTIVAKIEAHRGLAMPSIGIGHAVFSGGIFSLLQDPADTVRTPRFGALVSRSVDIDNHDPSANWTKAVLLRLGIPKSAVTPWNAFGAYGEKPRVKAINENLPLRQHLLDTALPLAMVAQGRWAQKRADRLHLAGAIFRVPHPSRRGRASYKGAANDIEASFFGRVQTHTSGGAQKPRHGVKGPLRHSYRSGKASAYSNNWTYPKVTTAPGEFTSDQWESALPLNKVPTPIRHRPFNIANGMERELRSAVACSGATVAGGSPWFSPRGSAKLFCYSVLAWGAVTMMIDVVAEAGTFERWVGSEAGWVSNDTETATLTKKAKSLSAVLTGHARKVGPGEAGFEIWIKVGCRASKPARPPEAWISLTDHPEQEPASHWLTDPVGFTYKLAVKGEFERVPVIFHGPGIEGTGTLVRRRVVAWTESDRPWLSVEFEHPRRIGEGLLRMIAQGSRGSTLVLSGPGTRIEIEPVWNSSDRALAVDMLEGCAVNK